MERTRKTQRNRWGWKGIEGAKDNDRGRDRTSEKIENERKGEWQVIEREICKETHR